MAGELDANDTNALLNEIDKLKQRLAGIDIAKVRIEQWYNRVKGANDTEARKVEKATLETVFRIFEIDWMRNRTKPPHLTLRNQAKFFYGLEVGAIFIFAQGYFWDEVVDIAKDAGVKVEYNQPSTAGYEEFGCFSGKVIGTEEKR